MKIHRHLSIPTALLVALLSAPAHADEHPVAVPAAGPSADAEMPVYQPPVGRGAPAGRVGGASRGIGSDAQIRLDVIAPDHLGLTASEQPTLYWFLSTAIDKPVETMISIGDSEKPVYDSVTEGPIAAGIHAAHLSQAGVKLKPDVDYEWTVAIVIDPQSRSNDIVASGHIERVAAAPPPSPDKRSAARSLAAAGLWYDAFDAASADVARRPDDATARHARSALLRQVNLDAAATYEEAAPGKHQ